jgi:uncharacterized protein
MPTLHHAASAAHRGIAAVLRYAVAAAFASAFAAGSTAAAQPGASDVVRERFAAQLGDGFVTEAEYVRPAQATQALPAVLLLHGASPADLDFTIVRGDGDTSRVLRDIAEALAGAGIASVRYHKRWVTGPGAFDMQGYFRTDLHGLLADARTMLDSLRTRHGVDPSRLFVWGWSEGSTLAAQFAAHDTVAGVIAHGPVVRPFHETLGGQFARVGVPYLLRFAAADSTLDLEAITRAERGSGGMLARGHAMLMLDPMALQRGERRLNSLMDADSSGRIHVTREGQALYERFYADGPMLGMYASARALPVWRWMADSARAPVLVLHGEEDANIAVGDARALASQVQDNAAFTVRIYPGLGHSLGKSEDPISDDFRRIDPAPLADAAHWIHRQVPRGTP